MTDADSTYVLLEEISYKADKKPITVTIKYLNNTETAETTLTSDYAGRLLKKENSSDIYGSKSFTSSSYGGNRVYRLERL